MELDLPPQAVNAIPYLTFKPSDVTDRMNLYNSIDRPLPAVPCYLEVILIKDWKLKINVEEMLRRVEECLPELMTGDEG